MHAVYARILPLREWGYMLYTALSAESTLLEGFTANGPLSCVAFPSCLALDYP